MIGQRRLLGTIKELVECGEFPGFTILVGPEGSGRRKMSMYVAHLLHAQPYVSGIGVEDIRQMIATAHKTAGPVVYIIPNADRMSLAAKNALLKVTEEPPRDARFIMTVSSIGNMLSTLISRAYVMMMDAYTPDEIGEVYADNVKGIMPNDYEIIRRVCDTPGEVLKLIDMGIGDFYDYVTLVVDNIAEVSASNSFKIGQKLAFKETDKGKYDVLMFLKGFRAVCCDRMFDDIGKYGEGVRITSNYIIDMLVTGLNKQSTFDMWLLDIRGAWM